jgi:transposase
MVISRDSMLRLVRALPDPPIGTPEVLGVDDFALRRGHVYGTVIIDMLTHRPLDLLADRTSDTLAAWLREHPGVQIVCRDRAGAYAEGIRAGAPDAVQVADRWHLWHNLVEAVERTVTKHRLHLRDLHAVALDAATGVSLPVVEPVSRPARTPQNRRDRVAVRTRERHAAIQALLAEGHGLRHIARTLNLGRNTVRRFARAEAPEELLVHCGTGQQPKNLEVYDSYLRKRWAEGCTNAAQLHRELHALGYRGASTLVRQYVRPWRSGLPLPPPQRRPPTVRQATGWFLRNPANLDPDDRQLLDTVCTTCPQLAAMRSHIRRFAEMMVDRRGHDLEAWMTSVLADDLPELHSFVAGLRRDQDAVTAGLTLPYSSGPVEGHINRIKMIKRQMYGRANPDLLRKRILLAD